jgi:serine/threonine protein kinase
LARGPLRPEDPARVGRYTLVARLGAGGMGIVYLGTTEDGRPVAVKLLRPELADDPEFRTRFGREVAALVRVRGVCTVRVVEADTTSSRPFLATEYADGPSLSEYVDAHGPLEPNVLYGLATGLAEALTAIHAAGIVHRDLKPSNVLLTQGGPKVIDFGIAQALDATAVTKTGMTVGSAGFMAPEQVMGQAAMASDIFSWGVTVAYAASGQPPFGTGLSEAILYRIMHAEPDLTAVPAALRPHLQAALAKDPQHRPSAEHLLADLTHTPTRPQAGYHHPTETVLAQTWHPPAPPTPASSPPSARPPAPAPPSAPAPDPALAVSGRPRRRRPVLLAVVLALAILAGAGGTALAFALTERPAPSHGPAAAGATTHSHGPAAAGATAHSQATPTTHPIVHVSSSTPATATSSSSPTPAVSTSASSSASATPSGSGEIPFLVAGNFTGIEPNSISFSADAGNIVSRLTWASWGASATGHGISDIDSCDPNCAQAPKDLVAATITLSDPVNGHYTAMIETRNDTTLTWKYPSAWALGAT